MSEVVIQFPYKDHDSEPYAKVRRVGSKVHLFVSLKPTLDIVYQNNIGIDRLTKDRVFALETWKLNDVFYSVSVSELRIDFYFSVVE